MKKCPKCGSENIKLVDYAGAKVIVCKKCGYDETEELAITPSQRETQREKRKYSPYRTGGKSRIRK
jgi:transcription initiation factor TFIIIB Brf1 subunit/transcription initiation factor TFIIB